MIKWTCQSKKWQQSTQNWEKHTKLEIYPTLASDSCSKKIESLDLMYGMYGMFRVLAEKKNIYIYISRAIEKAKGEKLLWSGVTLSARLRRAEYSRDPRVQVRFVRTSNAFELENLFSTFNIMTRWGSISSILPVPFTTQITVDDVISYNFPFLRQTDTYYTFL